ncbi:hypothetical protein JCGZ_08054 [Jatropha curcas]|uniref:MLO-like protein n=1 Tax=Jatropha curcas TaxID=180498 RepID=A0A067KP63_JATCU|nr:hypothetical protein JCGZ_08054 [Jatropha curcas]
MAAAPAGDRSLQETPTWALALVCAVFVIISILIEHGIHSLEKWFQKRHNKAMTEALEKIKAELMLLGFISLLLTVGTKYIAKICIPAKYGDDMLPCKTNYDNNDEGDGNDDNGNDRRRKLLSLAGNVVWRRVLAAAGGGDDYCNKKDKVPLISQTGVHQLHIFIFVLAVFHVLYSVLTMALAQAKMKKWKTWESETSSLEYQFTNDPSRFRLAHQTSFVKRHSGISTAPGIRWIVAFFRQFFGSVNKVDYLTMRNGFINILLLVGTKLELVIMEMAQEIQARTTVVRGAPVVEPNNKYFWFNRPQWILFLLHYTLFQNAFQMAFFLWTWYEFGLKSCFHENLAAILVRVGLGVALQIVCSYITFPLYALVTQMGSHMKQSIFEEQTAKALRKWQKAAKQRKKARKAGTCGGGNSSPGFMSGETTPSQGASPIHLLHGHKYRSSQRDVESVISSPKSYRSDTDFSELSETEGSSHHGRESRKQEDQGKNDQEPQTNDFSFVRI